VTAWHRRLFPLEDLSRSARGFWVALSLLLLVMALSVGFYVNIESRLSGTNWSVVDGIYMAVLTVTTIGFSEVHSLTQTGRLFTTGFAFTGVVLLALAARSAASLLVGQQLSASAQRRRRFRALEQIQDHYIVCGFGRMGREAVRQFQRRGFPVVIIEQDAAEIQRLQESDLLYVEGNATQDEVLQQAGVERARCLIAAAATDEDNLFIVLSARLFNPSLFIVARASQDATIGKLTRAGANRVLSPYVVGGRQLAAAAADPGVVDFLELVLHHEELDLEIAAVSVPDGSSVIGKPMLGSGVMTEGSAMILAVLDRDGKFHTNPRPTTPVNSGDRLIAIGSREQLGLLKRAVRA
jgi:voltage-gated potassium channel